MSIDDKLEGITPVPLWEVGAILGEGVLWDAPNRRVWFVDIKGRRLHRCAHDGADRRSWDAPGQVSFIVPASDGSMVCSLEDGMYRFDDATGEFHPLAKVEADDTGNRFNDGYVDAAGRLWFGSMDDGESAPTGALYRYDGRHVARMDDGYIITNGPAASPDGRTLYHTDTLGKKVYAFDLAADGALANKRLFVELNEGGGHPDGMAVDADGCVWIATFGGWRIDRYDAGGNKVGEVRFPCSNITKLAFGGGDLRTAYVTTARKGLSEEKLAQQPLAGALFTFRAETPGLPQHVLRIEE
ncbi:SMP-30/gluconolactonase/LRE family protein [Massilia forsythiae]|uniref:SMP-30/gluconolactonase/LRE family protein n=1 Tax=Massilia forsythiae TaxID=2728020 RepID=A0A7Z2VZC5_9BURK|nr:SMP-30/gluconolactonase/LRE family protein [Massilia forsythiae]QJE02076.1 SMP-30/gluconolactonase/LRE family protein [Massilia forsythiae]